MVSIDSASIFVIRKLHALFTKYSRIESILVRMAMDTFVEKLIKTTIEIFVMSINVIRSGNYENTDNDYQARWNSKSNRIPMQYTDGIFWSDQDR